MSVLSASALTMAVYTHYSQTPSASLEPSFGRNTQEVLSNVKMSSTPNIYFILADGYSSFAYLEENEFDVAGLRSTLQRNRFTIYPEMFSNYHSTLAAMPAVLNMEHHHYSASQSNNINQSSESARVIVGGNNNVVRFLESNNYETQYIHHGTYLLLKGCSAATCFPNIPLAGGRALLRRLFLPTPIHKDELFETLPLNKTVDMAEKLREDRNDRDRPLFQYLHLYNPAHSPNESAGRCNMSEELVHYEDRVSNINATLSEVVESIVERDSSAVIVLTSDHGPFISNECSRNANIDTLSDYRDRVGVLTAIRWPEAYDGRYDQSIFTTVNLFRYIFASLVSDDQTILSSKVSDSVYVKGDSKVLMIIDDGKILLPPETFKQ